MLSAGSLASEGPWRLSIAIRLLPLFLLAGCSSEPSDGDSNRQSLDTSALSDSEASCEAAYTTIPGRTVYFISEEGEEVPAPNASVEAAPGWGSEATQSIQTLSDAEGQFLLPLSEGAWRISATHPYGCQTSEDRILEVQPCQEESIVLLLDLCFGVIRAEP